MPRSRSLRSTSDLDPDGSPSRRFYDSPLRRQQVVETRERILAAGCALVRELPTWDWQDVTFRGIAERAGVSERTVYRYFASDRDLHDAVMRKLEQEAGVSYEGITIDNLAGVAAKVFAARLTFAFRSAEMHDPTLVDEDKRRRDAVVAAVAAVTTGWSETERTLAAAALDVLWSVESFERLTQNWELDPSEATRALDFGIRLIVAAIREGRRPQRKAR